MTEQLVNKTRYVFDLYYNDATWLYSLAVGLWLSLVILSYIDLLRFYPKIKGIKRTQTLYIIVGFLVGFLGGITNFLPMFKIDIYPFGNFTIPLYCIIVTYAVFRYRFLEMRIAIKKTMVYSLSAGLLTGLFVVIALSLTKFISTFAHVDSFKVSIIAALIITLLFNPIRNRIQTLVDRVFYKKTYDYYGTIQKVSHDLVSMFDFKKIHKFVGDIIFSTLGLKNIYLLSASIGGDYKVVYSRVFVENEDKDGEDGREDAEFKIASNSEIVKLLRTSDDIMIKDELPVIEEILGQEIIGNIGDTLKPFDGEAIVPVFIDDRLQLLFVLGEKLSADIFSNEDIRLLNTLSHQTSIAMKNAQLYAERFRTERLASIGMMSATFAHEIRNPLTSIKTFAQLIPEKYSDTEFRETFSKIVIDEIGRIDGLIKDLLSFSAKEVVPGLNEMDITALIDETLEHLKGKLELERRKINVEKIYKNVKINTLGDSKKLKQAFINIISNGCQAMEENGVLTVDVVPNGQNVDVKIIDTGKGISAQDAARIFDPFFTTKAMGVGLGLAISKKIIEDHGGRIKVESKLSKGTTFTISLPMQIQEGTGNKD
jgi:signal transduction histidine kinase